MMKGCIIMIQNNYCYMTLVTENRYLPCVKRCNQAMKYLKSKYPYIVLVPDDNEYIQSELKKANIEYRLIKLDKFSKKDTNFYADTINKFQLLLFTEYDKICFLDADIIVYRNIDSELDKEFEENIYIYSESKEILTGFIMLIKPEPEIYKFIVNNFSHFKNDEEVLQVLYGKQTGLHRIPKGVFHFGGYIKIWEKPINGFDKIKSFFFNMSNEEFFTQLDNINDIRGYVHLYSQTYNFSKRMKIYTIFIANESDFQKGMKMFKKMRYFGYNFPLVFILNSNNDKWMQTLLAENGCYVIYNFKETDTVAEKIKINQRLFYNDCDWVCYIDNLDLNITENFDYILSYHLDTSLVKQFFEKYKNDMILLQYRNIRR